MTCTEIGPRSFVRSQHSWAWNITKIIEMGTAASIYGLYTLYYASLSANSSLISGMHDFLSKATVFMLISLTIRHFSVTADLRICKV